MKALVVLTSVLLFTACIQGPQEGTSSKADTPIKSKPAPEASESKAELENKSNRRASAEAKENSDPSGPKAYLARGVEYSQKGQTDKAIADFTEAIRLEPKLTEAYCYRGLAYSAKGDFDKTIADSTEAVRLDPKLYTAYFVRGLAHDRKGQSNKAITDYTEAIRLAPRFAMAYAYRGGAYLSISESDKAIADSTEAIRLDPKIAYSYQNRGVAYLAKNNSDKAISDFTEAIRLDPKDAKAYYNRAIAYGQKGDSGKAAANFANARKLGVSPKRKENPDKQSQVSEPFGILDRLDPAKIRASERREEQPKELVAVLGTHLMKGQQWVVGFYRSDASVTSVAFSPDGKRLASAGPDGKVIHLWDMANLQEVAALKRHTGSVWSVAFSRDGTTLASGGNESVLVWDVSGEQPRERARIEIGSLAVALSSDGETLALGCTDKSVRVWDLRGDSPRELVKLEGHDDQVLAVAISPDDKMLASGGGRNVRVWDLNLIGGKPSERANLEGWPNPPGFLRPDGGFGVYPGVYALAFSPDAKALASGHWDGRVLVWNLQSIRHEALAALDGAHHAMPVEGVDDRCYSVAFSPDGRTLATSYMRGDVRLWDRDGKGYKHRATLNGATGTVWWLAFAPDGRHLATANENGTVYILRLTR